MNQSRLLIGLLLAATLALDCAVLANAGTHELSPHPVLILAWTLQLSQTSLMAVWLAVGKTSVPWRLTAAVTAVGLWSCALTTLPDAPAVAQRAVLLTLQTIAVAVPLLLMRPLGLSLIDAAAKADAGHSTFGRRRLQFSILTMIGWTTALAVILSTAKSMAPDDPFTLGVGLDVSVAVFLVGRGAVALAAAWAVLGRRWSSWRIAVLPVAVVAAIALQPLPRSSSADGSRYLAMLCLLEVLLLLGPLGVVRVAGFRLELRKETENA